MYVYMCVFEFLSVCIRPTYICVFFTFQKRDINNSTIDLLIIKKIIATINNNNKSCKSARPKKKKEEFI